MRLIVINIGLFIPYFSVGLSLNVFVASDVFVDQRRVRKDMGMLRGKSMLGARIGGKPVGHHLPVSIRGEWRKVSAIFRLSERQKVCDVRRSPVT